jgi:hypothetical protein
MWEMARKKDRFNWWLPTLAAIGTLAVFLPLIVLNEIILYALVILPVACVIALGFLLNAAITRRPRYFLCLLSMLVVSCVISAVLFETSFSIRNRIRWAVSSRTYKSAVLAEPNPAIGELKHIEWDGWGGFGAGDTTAYLVFDPTDSLAPAAKNYESGKFNGIPCAVPSVSRLERQWYVVVFYTDESWGKRNYDCN